MAPASRTLDPRPILLLLLVPLISYGSSTAYYGLRSGVFLYFSRMDGWSDTAAYSLYGMSTPATIAGAVLAAFIGAVLGGWGVTFLGMMALALGCATIGVVPDPTVPFLLTAVGKGMLTVGYYTVIADGFRGQRSGLLIAGFALLHASLALGAFIGPMTGANIGLTHDFTGLFGVSAIVAGTAAVIALIVGITWHVLGRHFPEPDARRTRITAMPHVLALASAAVGIPVMFLLYQSINVIYAVGFEWVTVTGSGMELFSTVGTVVTLATVAVVTLAAVGMHLLGVRARPLVVAGIGAVFVAVAVTYFIQTGWPDAASTGLPWPQLGVGGVGVVGEVLVSVFVLAGCARDLHWRVIAPFMALWTASLTGAYMALSAVSPNNWIQPGIEITPIAYVLPVGLVGLGILLAIAGLALERFWRPTAVPAPPLHPDSQ